MSCIGKEVVDDAAKTSIVDIVESKDIVTESASLKVSCLVHPITYTVHYQLHPVPYNYYKMLWLQYLDLISHIAFFLMAEL